MSSQSMVFCWGLSQSRAVTGAVVYPKYLPEGAKHSAAEGNPTKNKKNKQRDMSNYLQEKVDFSKGKNVQKLFFHVKGGLSNISVAMGVG